MADLVGYDDAAGTHNVVASCSGKSGISIRAFWTESARIEVHRGVNSCIIRTFRTDSSPARIITGIFADQIIMHIFAVDYLGPSGFCYHEEQTSFLEGCSFSFSKQPSPTRWPIRSGISMPFRHSRLHPRHARPVRASLSLCVSMSKNGWIGTRRGGQAPPDENEKYYTPGTATFVAA